MHAYPRLVMVIVMAVITHIPKVILYYNCYCHIFSKVIVIVVEYNHSLHLGGEQHKRWMHDLV